MSDLQPDLEELFWGSKAPKQGKYSLVGLQEDSWVIMMLIMIFFLCAITAGFVAGKYYHMHKQDKITDKTSTSLIQKSEIGI